MEKTCRTFIAVKIEPGPELLSVFDECREFLSHEAIKWVDGNNLHLTLKFLGDTTELQAGKIKNTLESIGSLIQPFCFALEGFGFFKSKGQPNVIFVGVKNFTEMEQLVNEIENRLAGLGFEKGYRDFKPHLTLGRINFLKDKKRFYNCVEKYKAGKFQEVRAGEIIFYQSILKPQGQVYVPLKIVKLGS